jgi:hypothetical protein
MPLAAWAVRRPVRTAIDLPPPPNSQMSRFGYVVLLTILAQFIFAFQAKAERGNVSKVIFAPPSYNNGICFRELFEYPI